MDLQIAGVLLSLFSRPQKPIFMKQLKSWTGYILVGIILLFTLISLLGVWNVIPLEDVVQKILSSLLIIFAAAVVALFVFNVLLRDQNEPDKPDQ